MGESIRLEDRWAGLARVLTVCREQRSEAEELVALRVQQAGLGTGEWRMELVDSGLWWISGLRAGGGGAQKASWERDYEFSRGSLSPLHTFARHLAWAVTVP